MGGKAWKAAVHGVVVKNQTIPFCKVPGKEPLEIPWPHPTTCEPIRTLGQPWRSQAQERRTNQNSTPNPSPEGDQSDLETPIFCIFPTIIPYISNVTQSSGLLSLACCICNGGSPSSSLVIKTLAFASDIGSLVVIGRFRELGIMLYGPTLTFIHDY